MANIQRDVLEPLAPALGRQVAAGGWLVLSGLLTSDLQPVRRLFEAAGFTLLHGGAEDPQGGTETLVDGEWGGLVLGPARVLRARGWHGCSCPPTSSPGPPSSCGAMATAT